MDSASEPIRLPGMNDDPKYVETPNHPLRDEVQVAIEFLTRIVLDRGLLAGLPSDHRRRLIDLAGQVYSPDMNARRQLVKQTHRNRKADKVQREEGMLAETGIRRLRKQNVFTTPNYFPPEDFAQQDVADDPDFREVAEPQHCYVCKQDFTAVHHFYDQLCPECARFNFFKRTELADLTGRVALLTGGRVKIGYQAGIKLLRSGARLVVTTRFPRDSAARYAAEPDFAEWGHRLEVFGLDLRHTPSVEEFCKHMLTNYDRLDFIINNACQTVRRPPDFYRHMMDQENASIGALPEHVRQIIGKYEGLRGYHMLPEGDAVSVAARRPG